MQPNKAGSLAICSSILLVYIIICVDVHNTSFCTLTLRFLCLLRGLSLSILPINKIFPLSDSVSFKENKLFAPLYYVVSKCHKMHLDLQNLLLDSKQCSNSLELLFFFQVPKCYGESVTMVLKPFTRHNF